MAYISSVQSAYPKVTLTQEKAKTFVRKIFSHEEKKVNRLLPVFDNAKVETRQIVKRIDWYEKEQSFSARNDVYLESAVDLSQKAIDKCLNDEKLKKKIPPEAIDLIVFVSSTGLATPSIDAHLINQCQFREDIIRLPLWGLGCAGGAIALSRGADWIKQNPTKTALIVTVELCSLTFQQSDTTTSNIVGTALFGDGVAAALLIGEASPYVDYLANNLLKVEKSSSFLQKNTLDIMGWDVTNHGFEVVFSKRIPRLVKTIWKKHLANFLSNSEYKIEALDQLIAHPGGRKVLEEMEEVISDKSLLHYSYETLRQHGNVSSATVLYVLEKYLLEKQRSKEKVLLTALGPGFCSELVSMRWVER